MFYHFFQETFYALTGALAIFATMETIQDGIVLAYININYVLLFWLLFGIVLTVFKKRLTDS